MVYEYSFDRTRAGDLRLPRNLYKLIHESHKLLRDEIEVWNQKAIDHGAPRPPYEREIQDLDLIIKWEEDKLAHAEAEEIVVRGISVGSLRYVKAALLLAIKRREEELSEKMVEGWPNGVIASLREGIDRLMNLERDIAFQPFEILWELIPRSKPLETESETMEWDAFISYASEDKKECVRPLAEALRARGLKVWYDELTLKVGDSLRRSIDRGLAHSRFGIVVISPNFLAKEWPQRELDGLVARELNGRKVILPVWHNIDAQGVRRYSLTLSDRVATSSTLGMDRVVTDLLDAMNFSSNQTRMLRSDFDRTIKDKRSLVSSINYSSLTPSIRSYLIDKNIISVSDVYRIDFDDLLRQKNVGRKGVSRFINELLKNNLYDNQKYLKKFL